MLKRLRRYLQRIHVIHTWNPEIQTYQADSVEWIGILWGWKHRYQRCDVCGHCRLIEGFVSTSGYYLRNGFRSEDTDFTISTNDGHW